MRSDFEMCWVEIDSYEPAALACVGQQSARPISSCEVLVRLRKFLPYFREQPMDGAIVASFEANGQKNSISFREDDDCAFRRRRTKSAHYGKR
jgi:hypothetical protein